MSFRNIRDEGIQKVANSAERLLLLPTDGTVVVQLDNNTLYVYDENTNTWNAVGGGGGGGNAFGTIQTPFGTSPIADVPSDVLTLSSSDASLTITGDALSDTVDMTLSSTGVTAGSYLVTGATIDSKGRVTAAQENYYLTIVNAIIFG
jgi:hypothetical protein